MFLDSKSKIAGYPALQIRDFLRRGWYRQNFVEYASEELKCSQSEATRILDDLVGLGYIEYVTSHFGDRCWESTVAGNALANASASRPVLRKTAERQLQTLLTRVHEVNDNEELAYRVVKVIVFGSYLSKAERLNDLDLAIALAPRLENSVAQEGLQRNRIKNALDGGRRFLNFLEECAWPMNEVMARLKSRSRTISLHSIEDGERAALLHNSHAGGQCVLCR